MTSSAPLRVLIVDDEPLARQRLASLVNECLQPKCTIVAQCADAHQAQAAAVEHLVDVALLDVQMPGGTGLELAALWRRLPFPPVVVFVTAYSDHALKAFDLEAADYLTKPVKRERLFEALARAAKRVVNPAQQAAAYDANTPVLVVTERGRVIRVPISEVLYLKAELKYVTLRTATHSYLLDDSLVDLEHRLGDHVLRVHRNALVSRAAVRALERRKLAESDDEGNEVGWAVQVAATGEWLAVSRRQASAVREALERS